MGNWNFQGDFAFGAAWQLHRSAHNWERLLSLIFLFDVHIVYNQMNYFRPLRAAPLRPLRLGTQDLRSAEHGAELESS